MAERFQQTLARYIAAKIIQCSHVHLQGLNGAQWANFLLHKAILGEAFNETILEVWNYAFFRMCNL